MYRAGLFGMLAPKAYGGPEVHPVEAIQVWEAVARIDSAAAWNLLMNQAICCYAAWLPDAGARELAGATAGSASVTSHRTSTVGMAQIFSSRSTSFKKRQSELSARIPPARDASPMA